MYVYFTYHVSYKKHASIEAVSTQRVPKLYIIRSKHTVLRTNLDCDQGKKIASASDLNISLRCSPGLPDGLFSNQKSQFGSIFKALDWEMYIIFYCHLEYFTELWDIY
jgi:hypothetical protein